MRRAAATAAARAPLLRAAGALRWSSDGWPRTPVAAWPSSPGVEAEGREAVAVRFADGTLQRFHWLWLRDNCPHESQITRNGQRLFETAELVREHHRTGAAEPVRFKLTEGEFSPSAGGEQAYLEVAWKDGHVSSFPLPWLKMHAYDAPSQREDEHVAAAATSKRGALLWDASMADHLTQVTYEELQTEEGLLWFSLMCEKKGFALVKGVPTELGMVERVGNMLGVVRRTNYGTIFDVIDKGAKAENLAYTTASITQHTDNPYRDPVPGVQLLHCLVAASGAGGETTLVDGFLAAERLRQQDQAAFELLSRHPRAYRYVDPQRGTDLRTDSFPVIEVDHWSGAVRRLRFNNRSAAPLRIPFEDTLPYLQAWAKFQGLLQDPAYLVSLRLAPGDLLAFQNHRVLHGRTAYQAGQPRHLQGAYIDVDALRSRAHAWAARVHARGPAAAAELVRGVD